MGLYDIAKTLIQFKANLNSQNQNKATALMLGKKEVRKT